MPQIYRKFVVPDTQPGQAIEVVTEIKRSRFLACLTRVNSRAEALAFQQGLKKRFPDVSHHPAGNRIELLDNILNFPEFKAHDVLRDLILRLLELDSENRMSAEETCKELADINSEKSSAPSAAKR